MMAVDLLSQIGPLFPHVSRPAPQLAGSVDLMF